MNEPIARARRRIPFADYLGLEVKDLGPDGATVDARIDETHHQGSGCVHGGFYCVIVEMAASAAATEWLQTEGAARYYPTSAADRLVPFGTSNVTDFLRPVSSGVLRGGSTPVHRGRRTQTWQVEIHHVGTGVLVAVGSLRLLNTGMG